MINLKQIAAVVLGLLALLTAAWGVDSRFITREIHELKSEALKTEYKMLISDIQKQMIQIQRNNALSAAQNQLWYWQSQVENLTGVSARSPYDKMARQRLTYAKGKRDYWQRKVNDLINP